MGHRIATVWIVGFCCWMLALPATPAGAAATAPARYTPLGPPPLPGALVYRGRSYAAGRALYKIGGTGTVPVYSLTLGRRPDTAAPLGGIDPESARIPGLGEATYLATCSASRDIHALRAAAAYQLAIWHFTGAVPLTPNTVPDAGIRRTALGLVASASAALSADPHRSCMSAADDPLTPGGFSKASYAPSISLASDETVKYQVISITLDPGNPNQYELKPQALELQIDGVPTFVCTGQDSTVDTAKARMKPVHLACGKKADPAHPVPNQLQYEVDHTSPQFPVDKDGHYSPRPGQAPLHGFAAAVVRLPRRGAKQQVRVLWNSSSTPGVVFVSSTGGDSVITAGVAFPNVDARLVVRPTTLSGFGGHVESDLLASLSQHGLLGLAALALLALLLITARDWFIPVLTSPVRFGRWVRDR
jgi:hypothetical protein